MQAYTKAILDRHNGNKARAIDWLTIERAQAAYILTNSRHVPTKEESAAIHARISAAIDELREDNTNGEFLALAIAAAGIAISVTCYAINLI